MTFVAVTTVVMLLVLGVVLLLWNRGAIVIAVLIPASDFLGWINPSVILVKGAFDTFAMLMIFIVLALLLSIFRLGEFSKAIFRWPFLILAVLWLYGLVAPVLRGDSGWSLAVNASKEFMMILAYPAMFLFLRTERQLNVAWNALLALGIYYCVLETVAQIGGVGFMNATSYYYRPDDFGLWKLYVQFWPVILIFLLNAVYNSAVRGKLALTSVLLGGIGLFLTFYRSYLLATMVAIPLVAIWARVRLGRTILAGAALGGVVLTAIGVVSAASGSQGLGIGDVGDDLLFSSFNELLDDTGGSLGGRKLYANELFKLADAHPLIGYGFVKQEAELIQKLHLKTFAGGMLGFVDKGNADVMIKFGYVGAAALYGAFFWIAVIAIRRVKRIEPGIAATRLLVVATLPPIFLMVQPVHAPCTYGFALLPFAIAMAVVDRSCQLMTVNGDQRQ